MPHGLTKAQILAAQDLPTERVACPEWGGDVIVRTLAGNERDAFVQECTERQKKTGFDTRGVKARLVQLSAVDDQGQQLFADDEVEQLNAKSSKVIERLFQAAQKLSGLSDEEVAEIAGN
jgi:DNA-binding ferritin-like protein